MKSNLFLKVLVALIFILAVVGMIMVANGGEDTSPEMASAASFMVNFAVVLLGLAAFLAVVMSLLSLFKNPAALKKTLLGLVVLGVLLAVSYFASSDGAVTGANNESLLEAGSVSKWSETGLNYSYILLVVGGVFFVWDLLKSLIKS
ncbi:hypothetical protein WH52_02770 [Tenacibaculum holothuriorum]|uniref:Uncharacterized protein n=1 Tax=Tenacibaculum holothuriorum TaxID=1635173 RepID=A0A1Y2PEL9_9FLAO|nr:hypothetical protein [Tenacibaculum holothuriorum]OSY88620.1 hypothetical protein WH52_02770 [Tenacibaculum holothuriorum]